MKKKKRMSTWYICQHMLGIIKPALKRIFIADKCGGSRLDAGWEEQRHFFRHTNKPSVFFLGFFLEWVECLRASVKPPKWRPSNTITTWHYLISCKHIAPHIWTSFGFHFIPSITDTISCATVTWTGGGWGVGYMTLFVTLVANTSHYTYGRALASVS